MSRFLNKNSEDYLSIMRSKIFVDKSGLINYINSVIASSNAFICNSRPRRFGKSTTVAMLNAYYSKGANGKKIFSSLEISKSPTFEKHLNKYDTIYIDIQDVMGRTERIENVVEFIAKYLTEELREAYPEIVDTTITQPRDALSVINNATGKKFVFIIDEWDVIIREANEEVQGEYINFLRNIFKGNEASRYTAFAYLTGILPIKKIKTESALNNFNEFTMISPGPFSQYIGFTESEVESICEKYNINFKEIERWYDGYKIGEEHIYNPRAVCLAIEKQSFESFWTSSGSFAVITPYISMNFEGLKDSICSLMSGMNEKVDTSLFQNDMTNITSKDEVLTLLIHLGYLGYNELSRTCYIPNEEIKSVFLGIIQKSTNNDLIEYINSSKKLLDATIEGNEEYVEKAIEKIHDKYSSAITYNNEASLTSTIINAYIASMRDYFTPLRKLPAGKGFADLIYLPKLKDTKICPALLIELKWNKTAYSAINQIKNKEYLNAFSAYKGDVLIVGIAYDKKTKKHSVKIERITI